MRFTAATNRNASSFHLLLLLLTSLIALSFVAYAVPSPALGRGDFAISDSGEDVVGRDLTAAGLEARYTRGVYCHHPYAGDSGQCFLSWDRLWDLRQRICTSPATFGFGLGSRHATWVTNCPGPIGIYLGSDSEGNIPHCWDRIADALKECLTDGREGPSKFADGTAWHHDGEVYKVVRYALGDGEYVNQKGPKDGDARKVVKAAQVKEGAAAVKAKGALAQDKDKIKDDERKVQKRLAISDPLGRLKNITGAQSNGHDGAEFSPQRWYNTFLRYFEAEQIHVPEHMTIHRVKYEGHRYDKYGQAMSAEAAAKQDAAAAAKAKAKKE